MRSIPCCLAMLVGTTAAVHAEPAPDRDAVYAQGGVLAGVISGGSNGGLLIGAAAIDVGVHIPDTRVWIRGMAATGTNFALNETSSLRQLRLGAELHVGINQPCVAYSLCALLGVDYGDQRVTWETVSWDGAPPDAMGVDRAHLLIPRLGLTMSSSHAQAGVVAELPTAIGDKLPSGVDVALMGGVRW